MELESILPVVQFNPDAPTFCPSDLALPAASFLNPAEQYSKKKFKTTVFDYLNKPKPKPNNVKQPKPEKPDDNRMVKAHIVIDGEVVTAKIKKKDLYSGAYEIVQRKTTKLKKLIKETRKEEGIPPNQRPLQSQLQYREYVTQMLTHDLDLSVQELIEQLLFFYNRKKIEKSNKKVAKRLIKGFKECLKKAKDGSMKMLIMAPDIEKIDGEGGLDALVNELLQACESSNIPIVFALSMRGLGHLLINSAALMSVVGVLDYSAAEKLFEKVVVLQKRNKEQFHHYCYDPSAYFNLGVN